MFEKYQSYLEYYIDNIKPVLNELDIALKAKTRLNNAAIAKILDTTEQEIENIRKAHNLEVINLDSLIKIMHEGSSDICRLFQREVEMGSPYTYTKEQLAYIYDIDIELVNTVCNDLNIKEVTWQSMPLVFGSLPYAGTR